MELYKIYKQIKQRSSRHPYDKDKMEMAIIANDIFEGNKTQKEILKIAKKLKLIELNIYNVRTYLSDQLLEAAKTGNYNLEKPYVIRHRHNDNNSHGWIYIMVSKNKPGQSKLGATTLDPHERKNKYINRYGYQVSIFYYSYVKSPFTLEKMIADQLNQFRVSGHTYGDSNEWYYIKPSHLKSLINKEK